MTFKSQLYSIAIIYHQTATSSTIFNHRRPARGNRCEVGDVWEQTDLLVITTTVGNQGEVFANAADSDMLEADDWWPLWHPRLWSSGQLDSLIFHTRALAASLAFQNLWLATRSLELKYRGAAFRKCSLLYSSFAVGEGFIQKKRQMSPLLLGRQNLFNSLPRQLFCTRTI